MSDLGRILIFLGLLLVVAGLSCSASIASTSRLAASPAIFNWRGRGWSVSFPLVTCLLLSVVA